MALPHAPTTATPGPGPRPDQARATRSEMPPLMVMPWSQFSEHPDAMLGLFESAPHRLIYDPNKVFVAFNPSIKDWAEKTIRTFQLTSLEQVAAVRDNFLTKPILLRKRIVMKTERQELRLLTRVRRITLYSEEFAVLINTKHPAIKHKLLAQFTKAEELLEEGGKFCISLSFSTSIISWMRRILQIPDLRLNHQSDSDTFYLTNHTRPSSAFSSMWWCCTMPCLFTPWCISYAIYRSVRNSKDSFIEFEDLDVKVLITRLISAQEARENLTLGLLHMIAESMNTTQPRTSAPSAADEGPAESLSGATLAQANAGSSTVQVDDEVSDLNSSYAGLRWVPADPNQGAEGGDPMEEYRRRLQRNTALSQLLAHVRTMGPATGAAGNTPMNAPQMQPPNSQPTTLSAAQPAGSIMRMSTSPPKPDIPKPHKIPQDSRKLNVDKPPEIELSDSESEADNNNLIGL